MAVRSGMSRWSVRGIRPEPARSRNRHALVRGYAQRSPPFPSIGECRTVAHRKALSCRRLRVICHCEERRRRGDRDVAITIVAKPPPWLRACSGAKYRPRSPLGTGSTCQTPHSHRERGWGEGRLYIATTRALSICGSALISASASGEMGSSTPSTIIA
jgi:hypothetical protein